MKLLPMIFALALTGCIKDETVSGYSNTDTVWRLVEIDGAATSEIVTLQFPEKGRISGKAPCNRYFGAQTVPYPWFKAEAVGSTKMACPNLSAEAAYFSALQDMSLAEVSGDTLILSNDAGRSLVFKAQDSIQ